MCWAKKWSNWCLSGPSTLLNCCNHCGTSNKQKSPFTPNNINFFLLLCYRWYPSNPRTLQSPLTSIPCQSMAKQTWCLLLLWFQLNPKIKGCMFALFCSSNILEIQALISQPSAHSCIYFLWNSLNSSSPLLLIQNAAKELLSLNYSHHVCSMLVSPHKARSAF